MRTQEKKNDLLNREASFFKILSSPHRLQLLNFISFAPRTVEDCSQRIGQSIQNTSLHLKVLANAGIVSADKVKNFNFYSIQKGSASTHLFSHLDSPHFSLFPSELICSQGLESLVSAVKKGEIRLVDLRGSEERLFINIPHAIVFDQKVERLPSFLQSHFSKKESLVFFCRGRICTRLLESTEISIKEGYNVKALPLSAIGLSSLSLELQSRF